MLAVGKIEPEAAAAWGSTIVAGWAAGKLFLTLLEMW